MRRHSPYNYAFNNPIFWMDPDGMSPMVNTGYMEISADRFAGSVDVYGGLNVTTFDSDGKAIDSKLGVNANNINIGLDGNIYNDKNSLDAANQGLMSAALRAGDIDPEGTPEQELSEIDMLIEKVPELGRLNEEGGKPKFDIRALNPGEMGLYDHPSQTAYISPNAFKSYLYLAFTVGHELIHAVFYSSGLANALNSRSSNAIATRDYSEYLAYRWELQWGNHNAGGYMINYRNLVFKSGQLNRYQSIYNNSKWQNILKVD